MKRFGLLLAVYVFLIWRVRPSNCQGTCASIGALPGCCAPDNAPHCNAGSCWCDTLCLSVNDCCPDVSNPPVCNQPTTCGSLPGISNGGISLSNGNNVGSVATYSCNSGFILQGDSIRTCGSTGSWSGSAPTCIALTCSSLPNPANGGISYTSGNSIGSVATYFCNSGFTLEGTSTRSCTIIGGTSTGWSGSAPNCIAIVVSPSQLLVRQGVTNSFQCSLNSPVGGDSLVWVKLATSNIGSFTGGVACLNGDGTIASRASLLSNEVVAANGGTLNFAPVNFGNEGSYVCTMRRSGSVVCYSGAVHMTVSPQFSVIANAPINSVRGMTEQLSCSAQGGPLNTFTWRRQDDNSVVATAAQTSVVLNNGADGGVFVCTVANAAGTGSDQTTVNVGPYITEFTVPQTALNGGSVTLRCVGSGFPAPALSWSHNSTQLVQDNRITTTTSGQVVTSVLSVPVAGFVNSGQYECRLTSSVPAYQAVTRTATLTVQDVAEMPEGVAALSIASRQITLLWVEPHDNNAPIANYEVQYLQPQFVTGNREVTITTTVTMATLTGLYPGVTYIFTITAHNAIGASLPSLRAIVRTLDEAPAGPPRNVFALANSHNIVVVTWDSVLPMQQNGVTTMYEVLYEPLETFGGAIGSLTKTVAGTETLTVLTNLEEFVNYAISVRAYTSAGPGPYSGTFNDMTAADYPSSPPSNINVMASSTTSITVSWDIVPPIHQNGIITMYEVLYQPLETFGGAIAAASTTLPVADTSVALSNLEEFVSYVIQIRAFTSVGAGPFSSGSTVVTNTDVPASPPTNPLTSVLSPTEISVTWGIVPPIDQNGVITMYEVLYEPLETFGGAISPMTEMITPPTMSVSLTQLEEYVVYRISIRAFTQAGAGGYTAAIQTRTSEDVPSAPPTITEALVISPTDVRVSWAQVDPIHQNGIITVYEVDYQPMNDFGVEGVSQVNTTATTIVLMDLHESVQYSITVRAFTSVGAGPFSNPVASVTHEAAPASPPSNTQAVSTSPTEITVTWDIVPPIDQNGIITMYEVLYQPLETFGGAIGTLTVNVTASEMSVTLTNLQEFVDYNISVRAYTRIGEGPYSEDMTVRTLEDVPASAPRQTTETSLSPTEIIVTWYIVPPIDQNGVITMYEVLYQPLETFGGAIGPSAEIVMAPVMSALLTQLEEYVLYNISVRAFTASGPGVYATTAQQRTLEYVPSAPAVIQETTTLSPTEVRVSWSEVDPIHQNGIVTVYEVDYQPLRDFESEDVTQVNTTATTIVLMDLHESVQYSITVRAFTSVGAGPFSNPVASVTHEAAPSSPPANVSAVTVSSTEILVTWDIVPPIDQNGIITMYEVLYVPLETFGGAVGPLTVNVSGSEMSVVLTDLEEFLTYTISVRAYTNVADGPYSQAIAALTFEDVPTSSPDNVITSALSSTEIQVTWDIVPPIDQNGVITMYEVLYEPLETFDGAIQTQMRSVSGSDVSVVLTGLQESVNYDISVRAYTSIGHGPYSVAITSMTLENAPASPPDNVNATVISSTEIQVTWGIVPPIDQNGIITMYEVLYQPLETFSGSLTSAVMNSSQNSALLADLQEFVLYNISVRAYTNVGEGPFSEQVVAMTLEDNPSNSPANVMSTALSPTTIQVDWDVVPPIDQNGIITMYEVLYVPLETFGGAIGPLTVNVSGTEMSVVLMDLEEYVNYSVSVRAYTSTGEGPYSDVLTGLTPEDPPASYPVNVTATANSSTTISVTWDIVPPIDQNGVITMYEVLYVPLETFGGAIGPLTVNVLVAEMSVVLMNLEEFVDYSISVHAYTSAGAGPYSDGVIERTNTDVPVSPPTDVMATVVSSTEILTMWDIVPPIDQNGIITMYEVLYEPLETFNGTIGPSTVNIIAPNTSVVLTQLEEYVFYNVSVRAFTAAGSSEYASAPLARTLEDVPSRAPAVTEAMVLSPTEVRVSWSEVDPIHQNGIITVYEVDYQPLRDFESEDVTQVNTTATTIVLMDLHESVQYSITVRAFTSVGAGAFSNPVPSVTHEAAPHSPPANVQGSGISSTDMLVTWDIIPPIDQNGVITAYEVLYVPLETFGGVLQTRITNVPGTETAVILTGLEEFVGYSISVRGFTAAGAGPYSNAVEATTLEDVPSSPPGNAIVAVVSSTEILVTWTIVPPIDQNGVITRYEVLYQPVQTFDGAIQTLTRDVPSTETSATLMGLQEFVSYTVSVRASTAVGVGPYSQETTVMTLEDAPASSPSNISAVVLSSTEIMVTWDIIPPIDQNGIITMYEVLYQPLETFNNSLPSSIFMTTTDTSHLISNIEEFVPYNISVRAYTSVGVGPFSEELTATTDEDNPSGPPTNIVPTTLSSTEIMVTWDIVPPMDQNGIITMYEVLYVPLETFGGAIGTLARNVSGLTVSVNLADLQEFVNYSISVRAYTSVGAGPYSSQGNIMTYEDSPASPPENATATANSSTTISVTWDIVLPIDQNGVITMYEVLYVPLETFGGAIGPLTVNVSGTEMSMVLVDLEEFVYYNISVRAYTSVGEGPYSDGIIEITYSDVPASPPANAMAESLSPVEISVTWDIVPPIDQNGVITMYEVFYVPLETFDGAIGPEMESVVAPNTTITLIGLQEYVLYTITVRAYTDNGPSDYTEALLERTLEDAPSSAPMITEAMAISPTEVRVSWSEVDPIHQNGIITVYEVDYQPLRDFESEDVTQVNTTATTIVLMDLHESVQYSITVRAFTSVGAGPFSNPAASVTHEEVPHSPPTDIQATSTTPTEITVTWDIVPSIDQNGIITMYEVLYVPLETFTEAIGNLTRNVSMPEMSVVLTDLQEFNSYDIFVRAYTSVGEGPYSSALTITTLEDAPASPPDSVVTTVMSSTEISVTWDSIPPINQNGIITMYEVLYQPLETFGGAIGPELMRVSGIEMSAFLSGLQEFVSYNISVRAYTSVGEGPQSDGMLLMTLEDVPATPPVNIQMTAASLRSITVVWEDVVPIDQNGVITTYEVLYAPLETFGGVIQSQAISVPATQMSVVLSGLEDFVDYFVSIRAYTSVGEGPYSEGMVIRTLENFPDSSPQDINGVANTSTTITVTWDIVPPIDQNGVITMYEVLYQPLETFGGAIGPLTVNAGTEMSVVLMDLQEYVNYSVSVRAYTSTGEGPYSDEIVVETLQDEPARPPTNVVAMSTSSSTISVEWQEVTPIDQNGVITMYEVLYEPLETFGGAIGPVTQVVDDQDTSVILTGLQEYVTYSISVRAFTEIGPSVYTAPVLERTDEDVPSRAPAVTEAMVLSPTEVRVSWSEVDPIHQNGIITVHEVDYQPLRDFESEDVTQVNTTATTIVLMDLHESVQYSITVRAFTSVGAGPFSNPVASVTHEAAPASAPVNAQSISVSSTEIMVTWDIVPPIHQNGIITMYEVLYQPLETFSGAIGPLTVNVSGTEMSVVLMDLEEFVYYNISVRAYTSVGEGPYSIAVTTQTFEDEPASSPLDIATTATSSRSVHVTWDAVIPIDQNGVITMYEVLYQPLETFGGAIEVLTTNVSQQAANLTDLEEFVNYTISVRAYTSVGAGPYSDGVMISTPHDLPSAPPSEIFLTVTSATGISASWSQVPSIHQNGIITLYEVLYYPLEDYHSTPPIVGNTSDLFLNLTGLHEFANYSIQVRAFTDVGAGPYSDQRFIRTDTAAPSTEPTSVNATTLSSTTIFVQWQEIPEMDRNGIVIQYQIMYSFLQNPPLVDSTAELSTGLLNLDEFELYSIRVRGVTLAGPGPYSDPVFAMTEQDAAGPVGNLPEADVTSTSAQLRWNPPEDPNGIITMYRLNVLAISTDPAHLVSFVIVSGSGSGSGDSGDDGGLIFGSGGSGGSGFLDDAVDEACILPGGDVSIETFFTFMDGNTTKHTLYGLTPYTIYQFRVQAATSVGFGPYSPLRAFATLESEPTEVLNLTATAINSSVIRVSWTGPQCPYGDISGYIVYYKEDDVPQSANISSIGYESSVVFHNSDSNTQMYDISGLPPYTNYSIHVQAIVTPVLEIGPDLFGRIELEIVQRTHGAPDPDNVPTAPPTTTPTSAPTLTEVIHLIGDPQDITTGRVILCAVVVVVGVADQNTTVYDSSSPYSEGSDFYIAAAWDEDTIYAGRVPSVLTVGDGEKYPTKEGLVYTNVPLRPNLLYNLFTRYDIYNDANPDQPHRVYSLPTTSNTSAEVPPIVATLTISPGTPHFITGMTLNVTCSVQIPKELISVPLEVTAQWTISGTVLQSDSRVVITEPVLVQPLLYQISLVISYLDKAEGDEGDYTCTVKINSPGLKEITVSASETIEIPTMYFQLILSGIDDCETWIANDPIAKDNDLVKIIADGIEDLCRCGFTEDRITDVMFQCFPDSPKEVTFRAQLHGTPSTNVSDLINDLKTWSSFDILHFPPPLNLEGFCTLNSSTPMEVCPGEVSEGFAASAGAAIGVVIALIFIVVVILVVAMFLLKYKRRDIKKKLRSHPVTSLVVPNAATGEQELNELNGVGEISNTDVIPLDTSAVETNTRAMEALDAKPAGKTQSVESEEEEEKLEKDVEKEKDTDFKRSTDVVSLDTSAVEMNPSAIVTADENPALAGRRQSDMSEEEQEKDVEEKDTNL